MTLPRTGVVQNESADASAHVAFGHAPTVARPAHGRLRLRFDRARNSVRTVLAECEQRPPLKVVRAFTTGGGGALVHLHNLSGGVLGGDRLELSVEADEGARVQLTSTGATRLYRSRQASPAATQRQSFRVGEGALLEYLPDELIPFAGARFRQETIIELEDGAGLFCWETVAPGRAARGELFAYESLEFRLDLTARGVPLAQERVALEPSLRPLQSPARLGPYLYFATFYACRVGPPASSWFELEGELAELARRMSKPSEALWGVSRLPAHGVVVKALSVKGRDATRGLHAFWRAAKLKLYDEPAVPPRKIH